MIYMRGLKAKELFAVVDFIYHGEANIYQEDLDEFLALAEELQLKGLVGSQNNTLTGIDQPEKKTYVKMESHIDASEYGEVSAELYSNITSIVPVDSNKTIHSVDSNKEELSKRIDSMAQQNHDGDLKWECKVCGKATKLRSDIRRHIETHIRGISHNCNQCGKVTWSTRAHLAHKSTCPKNKFNLLKVLKIYQTSQ